jgi:D-ribose pyranase
MRRSGLLHPELLALVARAGHTDIIVIADAGLPLPRGVPCIDLSVRAGLPSFLDVLGAITDELVIEGATVASEMRVRSSALHTQLLERLPITPAEVDHQAFKAMLPNALGIVRTGETTPYANIALHCGVSF